MLYNTKSCNIVNGLHSIIRGPFEDFFPSLENVFFDWKPSGIPSCNNWILFIICFVDFRQKFTGYENLKKNFFPHYARKSFLLDFPNFFFFLQISSLLFQKITFFRCFAVFTRKKRRSSTLRNSVDTEKPKFSKNRRISTIFQNFLAEKRFLIPSTTTASLFRNTEQRFSKKNKKENCNPIVSVVKNC